MSIIQEGVLLWMLLVDFIVCLCLIYYFDWFVCECGLCFLVIMFEGYV